MLNSFYDRFIFTNALHYKHNNFFFSNVPFVIAPSAVFSGIAKVNNPDFQKQVYSSVKKEVMEQLVRQLDREFELKKDRLLEFFFAYCTASGFGLFEAKDISHGKKRALVSISNAPFAVFFPTPAKHPVDSFLRGLIAGAFSVVFEENVDCVETECSAMGASYCSFVVKPPHDFDFSNHEVREQLPAE